MVKRCVGIMLFLALAGTYSVASAAGRPTGNDRAQVTMLIGSAKAVGAGKTGERSLRKGSRLSRDQEVRVGKRSRIELRFPDGTVMRFAERSTVKLNDVYYSRKSGDKTVSVGLALGKLWANVRKLLTSGSRVEVRTTNAVAGVRGTIYRVNAEEDNSAMVKVYDGSVAVSGIPRTSTAAPAGATVPVPGPHEVPPPYHEVTMEEWHVIVQSFQQITISPDGRPSEPTEFKPEEDADDWVRWNQQRDKELSF